MLRIKEKYLGKRIMKGRDEFNLNESLTQSQLLYINNMVSNEFVEEVKESQVKTITTVEDKIEDVSEIKPKSKVRRKRKTNDKNNKESK